MSDIWRKELCVTYTSCKFRSDKVSNQQRSFADHATTIMLTEISYTLSIDEKMKVSINASSDNKFYAPTK